MRPGLLAAAVAGLSVPLGGCFTTSADYRKDAEKFIIGDEGLATATDTTFASADCDDPPDRNTGTTFACTGIDARGRVWGFEVAITGSKSYEVTISDYPPSDSPPSDTPAGT